MAAGNQPRLIDHYALRELLGRGHFGEVWRVADLVLDQEVALKLMGPNVTLQQALIESRTHNRTANHDRVVRVHTVKMRPPGPYIVMDYLANGSIGKRLNAGNVSLVEAVRWTREALDGLTYVHELGIIHRDIKPDNLLLDANERAVITDFGVSEDTVRNLHASRRIYAAHRAPELDTQPSSRRSDIWAVGCTLYRLVTGEYPFLDEQAAAAGRYIPPHALSPQVPRSLSRVIACALEVDAAARYPDAPASARCCSTCQSAPRGLKSPIQAR